MMPSEKNTKRVILALDQAYEKFVWLEDKSTDAAEIVAYRCYYTNIYESKLYVEQMQKEIDRLNELLKDQQAEIELLKSAKNKAIEKLEIKIETRKVYRTGYFLGVADGLKQALDLIKKDGEQE